MVLIMVSFIISLQVLFDKKKRARSVVFEREGKRFKVKAKEEIILSAGAIGSPAILMRSGVGPADHLHDLNVSFVFSNVQQGIID